MISSEALILAVLNVKNLIVLHVHPDSLWRILGHYVDQAVQQADLSSLTDVGIDEVAKKKGHEYITVLGDLRMSKVVYLADTRESSAIEDFADYLKYKLSQEEEAKLASLKRLNLKTARAHAIVESLRETWNATDKNEARFLQKKWYFWATHSRLEPIKEFAKTVRNHWEGIPNVFDGYITNGLIEGLDNQIKTAMKRAYGFKSFAYFAHNNFSGRG